MKLFRGIDLVCAGQCIAVLLLTVLCLLCITGCQSDPDRQVIPTYYHPRYASATQALHQRLDIDLQRFTSPGEVNDFVNTHVRYLRELPGMDIWQEPSETLETGYGDCEDYALLKMAILAQRFPAQRTRILLVAVRSTGGSHAVLVLQDSIVFDQRLKLAMDLQGTTFRNQYIPKFFVRSQT